MVKSNLTNENGIVYLQGEITFSGVAGLAAQLEKLLTSETRTIDCHGVTKADSSAVALLLHSLHALKKKKVSLEIVGVSEALNALIELYDVDNFLQVKKAVNG